MSCRDLPRQVMLGRKLPTRTGDFSELVDSNLPVIFLENLRFFLVSGRDLQMSDSWKDFIGYRFFLFIGHDLLRWKCCVCEAFWKLSTGFGMSRHTPAGKRMGITMLRQVSW